MGLSHRLPPGIVILPGTHHPPFSSRLSVLIPAPCDIAQGEQLTPSLGHAKWGLTARHTAVTVFQQEDVLYS